MTESWSLKTGLLLLDGAVTVHSLPTTGTSTFNEYADRVFMPHLEKQLQGTSILDAVLDRYLIGSLKESTREKRGRVFGERCQVSQNYLATG